MLTSENGAEFDLTNAESDEDSGSDHMEQPALLTRDAASCYNADTDDGIDVDAHEVEDDLTVIPPPRNLSLTETIASADHNEAESASATVTEDTSALISNPFPMISAFSRHQRREFRTRMALSRIQRHVHAYSGKMRGGAWNHSNRATRGVWGSRGRRYGAFPQDHGPCKGVSRAQLALKKQQGGLGRAMSPRAARSKRDGTRELQAHQGFSGASSGEPSGEFWEKEFAEARIKSMFAAKVESDEGRESGMREEGWLMGKSAALRSILGHGSLVREVDRCKMCRVWVERISLGDCAAESTYGADVCAALDHGHDVTADISREASEHGQTGIHTATETATATGRSESQQHGGGLSVGGEGLSSNISVASTNASAISSARSTSTYSTSTYVSGSTAGDAIGRSLALGCSLAFGSTLAIATSISFGGSLAIASSIAFGSSLAVVSSCAVDDSTGRRRRREGGKNTGGAAEKRGAQEGDGETGKAEEGKKGSYEAKGREQEGSGDGDVAGMVAAPVESSSKAARSSLISRRGRRQSDILKNSFRRSSSFTAPTTDAWFPAPLCYSGAQSEGSFSLRPSDAAFPKHMSPCLAKELDERCGERCEEGETSVTGSADERDERCMKNVVEERELRDEGSMRDERDETVSEKEEAYERVVVMKPFSPPCGIHGVTLVHSPEPSISSPFSSDCHWTSTNSLLPRGSPWSPAFKIADPIIEKRCTGDGSGNHRRVKSCLEFNQINSSGYDCLDSWPSCHL
ncbi:unnamed protein product [Closterium sp. Yama58-4]|nr:unnamed protein product [Closterium sp. Yama58-4]